MQTHLNQTTTGSDLAALRIIRNFIADVAQTFAPPSAPETPATSGIRMYDRMLKKIDFGADDALIERHIRTFAHFCRANRDEIRAREVAFLDPKIEFTEKIYIDMQYVFAKANEPSRAALWEYILTISAYLDPENGAKDILREMRDQHQSSCNVPDVPGVSPDLLASMMSAVGGIASGLQAGAVAGGGGEDGAPLNPAAMLMGVMNSQLGQSLVKNVHENIENGTIDVGEIMRAATGMVDNVRSELANADNPMLKDMLNTVSDQIKQANAPRCVEVDDEIATD